MAICVKFSPDAELIAWCVCVAPVGGVPYVELIGMEPAYGGIDMALAFIAEHKGNVSAVIVDGQTGASDFVERVHGLGVSKKRVSEAGTTNYIEACSTLHTAVGKHELAHCGQELLTDSMTMARRRKVGRSGVGFADGPDMPCAAAESAALALWAARTTKRDPRRKGRIG